MQLMSRSPFRLLALAASVTLFSPIVLADSVPELRSLLDANNGAAAWDMAMRMEPENAGNPEFDFWYGLAAKAAGKDQQSVLAFERVLVSQPDNARAKLELGDAYYRMGNQSEARRLFEDVLATTPPDAVQQKIRTYLSAMSVSEQGRKTRVSGYVAVAGGYDSNISSATNVVDHDINLGGVLRTIELSPLSLRQGAAFGELRAGVDVVQPVNQRQLRFFNVNAQRRDNAEIFSGGNFDYSVFGVSGGWMLRRGTATWRIPLAIQALWAESESTGPVNDDRYTFSIGAEYGRPLSARTSVAWFGQAGNAHTPSDENRNLWQLKFGGSYNWSAEDLPLRASATALVGTDIAELSDQMAEVNGRDYAAARLNLLWRLSDNQSINGALGAQASMYHAPAFFSNWGVREDVLLDASLGWQWQVERDWTINADVAFANNSSFGTDLYDYARTQMKLGATWRF